MSSLRYSRALLAGAAALRGVARQQVFSAHFVVVFVCLFVVLRARYKQEIIVACPDVLYL